MKIDQSFRFVYVAYTILFLFLLWAGCYLAKYEMPPGDDVVVPQGDIVNDVQILLGINKVSFYEKFPSANLENLEYYALDFHATFYGAAGYEPKMTGEGLDFTIADRAVPKLLAHPNADDITFWFPVSPWNLDRLPAIYAHWQEKGWLSHQWYVFIHDEPRTTEEIIANNQDYQAFKQSYPEILWLVTHEGSRIVIGPDGPELFSPRVEADIHLAHFDLWEIEKGFCDYCPCNPDNFYTNTIKGGYFSGIIGYPESFNPNWTGLWKKYLGQPQPVIPTFGNGQTDQILDYCRANSMTIFLFWNAEYLFDSINGKPWPNEWGWELVRY